MSDQTKQRGFTFDQTQNNGASGQSTRFKSKKPSRNRQDKIYGNVNSMFIGANHEQIIAVKRVNLVSTQRRMKSRTQTQGIQSNTIDIGIRNKNQRNSESQDKMMMMNEAAAARTSSVEADSYHKHQMNNNQYGQPNQSLSGQFRTMNKSPQSTMYSSKTNINSRKNQKSYKSSMGLIQDGYNKQVATTTSSLFAFGGNLSNTQIIGTNLQKNNVRKLRPKTTKIRINKNFQNQNQSQYIASQ